MQYVPRKPKKRRYYPLIRSYHNILDDCRKGIVLASNQKVLDDYLNFWGTWEIFGLISKGKNRLFHHPDIYTTITNVGYKRELFSLAQQNVLDDLRVGKHDVSYVCYPDVSAESMKCIVHHCEAHGGHSRRLEYWKVARVKGRACPERGPMVEFYRTEILCRFANYRMPFCDYANIEKMSDEFLRCAADVYDTLLDLDDLYFSSFSTKISFIEELNKLCLVYNSFDDDWEELYHHLFNMFNSKQYDFNSRNTWDFVWL
jgi:hypothetical protein